MKNNIYWDTLRNMLQGCEVDWRVSSRGLQVKLEAARSFLTTQRHNPEDHDFNLHHRGNLKSCLINWRVYRQRPITALLIMVMNLRVSCHWISWAAQTGYCTKQ
jgi:hypothetical protein